MALKIPKRFRRKKEVKFVILDNDTPDPVPLGTGPAPGARRSWFQSALSCLEAAFSSQKKRMAAVERARLSVEHAIELIEEKEEKLSKTRDKMAMAVATSMAKKNIDEAVQHLKRKKWLEKQLQKHRTHRFNLETQMVCLEEALTNTEVSDAMKSVTLALKRAGRQIGDTEDTIDDLQEIIGEASDISNMLQEQLSHPDYLADETLRNELLGTPDPPPPPRAEMAVPLPNLPTAPEHKLAPRETKKKEANVMHFI